MFKKHRLPLDVLDVCDHQEVGLRTVWWSGGSVFEYGNIRAVLFLTVYFC